jgi:mannitol operon repressor
MADMSDTIETVIAEDDELLDELYAETDRGVIVLAAALLDELVGVILLGAMIDDSGAVGVLMEGPLGSFAARIQAAYCLGVISQGEYADLNVVHDLRHRAMALGREPVAFDAPDVVRRCRDLHLAERVAGGRAGPDNTRARFVGAVVTLVNRLLHRRRSLRHAAVLEVLPFILPAASPPRGRWRSNGPG